MKRIIAIDPGTTQSAVVVYAPEALRVEAAFINDNEQIRTYLYAADTWADLLAIEMIASYGMAVGKEVFETCLWIGRFVEAWSMSREPSRLVYRRDVKLHLCGTARAKDPNVRQALLDRWGGRENAMGKKKAPGPLFGLKTHLWPALAVAVTAAEVSQIPLAPAV